MNDLIIKTENLSKSFRIPDGADLVVLDGINLEIERGVSTSITGKSGCGKSTLLQLCASLMRPTSGKIYVNNVNISHLSDKELCKVRNQSMGFIFQNSLLLDDFTVKENVAMPQLIAGISPRVAYKKAEELLDLVGLKDRMKHRGDALSGGEKQRCAIARSLSMDPSLIFADEPTGSLDEERAHDVEELLLNLVREKGCTLLLVTHDLDFAKRCDTTLELTYHNIKKRGEKDA